MIILRPSWQPETGDRGTGNQGNALLNRRERQGELARLYARGAARGGAELRVAP